MEISVRMIANVDLIYVGLEFAMEIFLLETNAIKMMIVKL
jgi:hypothetical protein